LAFRASSWWRNWPGTSVGIYGFAFDDAKAFFTTAENFAQFQASEASSQRVDFDRSAGRFGAVGGVGVNTIGGPTG
jgi:hypothetical protein